MTLRVYEPKSKNENPLKHVYHAKCVLPILDDVLRSATCQPGFPSQRTRGDVVLNIISGGLR